jgi:chromosome partitioning protein
MSTFAADPFGDPIPEEAPPSSPAPAVPAFVEPAASQPLAGPAPEAAVEQSPGEPATATLPPAADPAPAGSGSVEEPPVPVKLGPTGRPAREFPEPAVLEEHGPARIIAMCNQKGGVGKTTSTINLGAALAELGRRVLLVDFDPQGALSVGLGVNPLQLDRTVYNLLMDRTVTVDDVMLKTHVPNLDLLPSNIDLSAAEVQLVGEVAREQTLLRVLQPVLGDYDVVLIDCQPSLGLLTVNALTAAHGVIIPLECEFFALRGVALLIETIDKVKERLNPQLDLEGILATMYDSRTLHGREVLARVVEAFDERVFHTVISRTVRFPETTVAGEPITTYAPSSTGAKAYRDLAKEVLAR